MRGNGKRRKGYSQELELNELAAAAASKRARENERREREMVAEGTTERIAEVSGVCMIEADATISDASHMPSHDRHECRWRQLYVRGRTRLRGQFGLVIPFLSALLSA